MTDNGIISCSDIMREVCDISLNPKMSLPSVWKNVVKKIKSGRYESEDSEKRFSMGDRLAGNTRVIDLKNGVLLVETDHPGWIQYLQMYQKFIIKGLKMHLPDLEINSLAFRVAGSNVQLSDSYEDNLRKNQELMNQKIESQEKVLNQKYDSKNIENKEKSERKGLPPELLEKFESIKNTMLTNSKK